MSHSVAATREANGAAAGRELGLLWGGIATLMVVMSPFAGRLADGVPICVFKALSGLPCVTCGTTRAAVALSRCDIPGALALNPLATLAWIVLVGGGLVAGVSAVLGRPVREPSWRFGAGIRVAVILVLLANWAYLIAAGV